MGVTIVGRVDHIIARRAFYNPIGNRICRVNVTRPARRDVHIVGITGALVVRAVLNESFPICAVGDRIRLEKFCKMLFEVADLQYASPATISRCGMVYVDPRNLGYEPYWYKWMLKFSKIKEKIPDFMTTMDEVYPRYIPHLMARIFDGVDRDETYKPLEFTLPRTNLNLLQQVTRILDSLLNMENLPDPDKLESMFIYATLWGLGACLTTDSKKIFE